MQGLTPYTRKELRIEGVQQEPVEIVHEPGEDVHESVANLHEPIENLHKDDIRSSARCTSSRSP